MANRDVIVMAASAGGIEALQAVLAGVPADLAASVLVVLHIPPAGGQVLPRILDRAGPLHAATAVDGEPLQHGRVYIAPGDHHLVLGADHVHVVRGPRENGSRPAADPLFRSAARYHRRRVIGVVLSGALSDGTAGLSAIRHSGGVAVIQDPDDALYAGMPTSALEYVGADHLLPAGRIGALLAQLAAEDLGDDGDGAHAHAPTQTTHREVAFMEGESEAIDGDQRPGRPSQWPCPDCSGVLWQIEDGPLLRFRCRVGHAWSAENLLDVQRDEVETALWMALRALEDRAALLRVLAERADHAHRRMSAERHRVDVGDMERSIEVLRRVLHHQAAEDA